MAKTTKTTTPKTTPTPRRPPAPSDRSPRPGRPSGSHSAPSASHMIRASAHSPGTTPYTISEDKVEIVWILPVSRLMQRPPEGYLVHQVDIRCTYKVPDSGIGITDMEFLMRQLCIWHRGEFVGVGSPMSDPSIMHYHLRTFSTRRAVRVADIITHITTATLVSTVVTYALIE